MRHWIVLGAAFVVGCKGEPTDTDINVNCEAEITQPISAVAVPDWPAGLEASVAELVALDGRYTASACGEEVVISIRTPSQPQTSTQVDIVTTPLPRPNGCGCTVDPSGPDDGSLNVIGYSQMDFFVQDYPNPGFRDENAGNVAGMTVALFDGADGLLVRGCTTELVPPILGLPVTDADVVVRSGSSGLSATVRLWGEGVPDETCELTNFVRIGDNG